MKAWYRGLRVLITGGAGVVGTELIQSLVEGGARVLCCDLKPRPEEFGEGIEYIQGDANHLTVAQVLVFDPQVCFHLAATFERAIETQEFWEMNAWHNVRLSHHVASLMRQMPALIRVVFASSYLIYDPALYMFEQPREMARRLDEATPIYPRNICGGAKLLHELELRFLSELESTRFTSISARIYRVYGKGSMDVVSRWVRSLIHHPKEPLTVYGEEAMFDYIYAGDVAEGLLRLGTIDNEGIVNLGSGQAKRVSELVAILRGVFPSLITTTIPTDIGYESHQADLTRLQELLGWTPPTSLEEGVGLLVGHERERAEAIDKVMPRASVMVTSASRKVPLIERYRCALDALSLDGQVIAADLDPNCVARLFADDFWNMPRLSQLSTGDLIDACRKRGVRLIVPTRDGELGWFAERRGVLEEAGVMVLVSPSEGVRRCLDKVAFHEKCVEAGLSSIPTASTPEELINDNRSDVGSEGRFVVKERYGAGSRTVRLNLSLEEARRHAATLDEPIVQPMVEGEEYSVDAYVARDGTVLECVPRVRSLVVRGESVITETREFPELASLCVRMVEIFRLRGALVIQAIVDRGGRVWLIECNPRVGGGSTLSFEAGCLTPRWSLMEALGWPVDTRLGRYERGLRLVRYASDRFDRYDCGL